MDVWQKEAIKVLEAVFGRTGSLGFLVLLGTAVVAYLVFSRVTDNWLHLQSLSLVGAAFLAAGSGVTLLVGAVVVRRVASSRPGGVPSAVVLGVAIAILLILVVPVYCASQRGDYLSVALALALRIAGTSLAVLVASYLLQVAGAAGHRVDVAKTQRNTVQRQLDQLSQDHGSRRLRR